MPNASKSTDKQPQGDKPAQKPKDSIFKNSRLMLHEIIDSDEEEEPEDEKEAQKVDNEDQKEDKD